MNIVQRTIGLYQSAEFHVRLLNLCRKSQHDIRTIMESGSDDQTKNIACHTIVRDRIVKPLFEAMNIGLNLSGQENLPNDDSFIIAANHNSELDHLVTTTLLGFPTLTLAKESVKKVPFMGEVWGSAITECIDRSNPRKALEGLNHVENKLKSGQHVVMFPEGTRNGSDKLLLPFNTGASIMSLATNKKIVPLVFHNTRDILSKPQNKVAISPLRPDIIYAEFLPALSPSDYQSEMTGRKQSRQIMTDELRNRIGQALMQKH